MNLIVFFDLPTTEKTHRRIAANFRKTLLNEGFLMIQKSIYVRYCNNNDAAEKHLKRIEKCMPNEGMVLIQIMTDKQFAKVKRYENSKKTKMPNMYYAERGIEIY